MQQSNSFLNMEILLAFGYVANKCLCGMCTYQFCDFAWVIIALILTAVTAYQVISDLPWPGTSHNT